MEMSDFAIRKSELPSFLPVQSLSLQESSLFSALESSQEFTPHDDTHNEYFQANSPSATMSTSGVASDLRGRSSSISTGCSRKKTRTSRYPKFAVHRCATKDDSVRDRLFGRVRNLERQLRELKERVEQTQIPGPDISSNDLARIRESLKSLTFSTVISEIGADECPIIAVSRGFCDMTGWEPWEIVGTDCRFLQCPETDNAAIANMRQFLNRLRSNAPVFGHEDILVKLLNQRKDGSRFWNLVHMSPVLIAGKLHVIGSQSEVSQTFALDVNDSSHKKAVADTVRALYTLKIPQNQLGIDIAD